jgi:hypothetical protein
MAIATFSTSNLTPAELQQKTQYEQAMARNQAIIDRPPRSLFEMNPDAYRASLNEKTPWVVAQKMIPELRRTQQQDSCVSPRLSRTFLQRILPVGQVWTLTDAIAVSNKTARRWMCVLILQKEFQAGVSIINELREVQGGGVVTKTGVRTQYIPSPS